MENKNIRVAQLSCEYTSNPLGINNLKPLFSWSIHHSERNQKQSAYQIIVASSLENAKKNIGDMWDSKEVNTDQSTVKYQGKLLESKKTYYWIVRVWDKDRNMSPYSEISSFEVGLLYPEDWQGLWIGKPGKGSPLFRKEFKIDKEIKRARVYVSGLGYCEIRLNGSKMTSLFKILSFGLAI
jgi:alpha-L-rhamnosidase